MSEVIRYKSNGRKEVCIRDSDLDMIFISEDDWDFLQTMYGLSSDTDNLLSRVWEILDDAAEPGSRLTHEW